MAYELKEDQKGISNVIVVMIAIGMALAGGFVVYGAFRNYLSSSTSTVSLQVTYLKALQVTGGEDYASATVKNTGTMLMEDVTVTIITPEGKPNVEIPIGDLDPGETGSGKATGMDLAAGTTYPVEVTASSPEREGAVTLVLEVRVS